VVFCLLPGSCQVLDEFYRLLSDKYLRVGGDLHHSYHIMIITFSQTERKLTLVLIRFKFDNEINNYMMSSIIEGYNYDIFISYRQKDNKHDGWVTKFVDNLKGELEATFKEDVSVYFDENPHDRLQETHNVDKSLEGKLNCLIFIPILSQTYCDPNSYAWQYEFMAFLRMTEKDRFGKDIKLRSGNVASRILPIRIHDLEPEDVKLYEKETGSVIRALDFVFKTSTGVNRPLKANEDHPQDNLNKTFYSDQINKVAHSTKEIILGMKAEPVPEVKEKNQIKVILDEMTVEEKRPVLTRYTSLVKNMMIPTVAIVSFLIIAGVLLYPKIFKRDKFEEIRDTEGKISVAVMPFENLTGDTTMNWFQRGISSLIINGLGGSSELALRDDQTMFEVMESMEEVFTAGISPSQAKKVAEKVRAETYISGSFQGMGGKYRILTKLVYTKSGDIICTNQVEGDLKSSEYLALTDSLCNELKDYLEIKSLEQKADYDFKEAYPNSAEAYRYFIEGVNLILTSDYEAAIKSLKKALEIDSTFTFASFYIAFAYDFWGGSQNFEQGAIWTQRAYKGKDRLPVKYQNWLEMWYACFVSKNPQDITRYCNLLEKSGIESRLLWFDLGVTYYSYSEMYDKAVEAFEKVEEISLERGIDWKYDRYYRSYCEALLLADRPEEAKRISEQINPKNDWLIVYQGSINIMLRDTIAAEKSISEIRSMVKRDNSPKSIEEWAIGYMYLWAKDTIMVEKHFRKAYNLDPENLNRISNLSWILIRSGINIKEGMELAEKGLKTEPDRQFLLWMKGLALHKSGKHEEALIILKEANEKSIGYLKELKKDIKEVEQTLASLTNN
jgi:TolB-like protein